MIYAIISDIHSNIQALETALDIIKGKGINNIICLGDIVGYNANPSECVELIRSTSQVKHIIQGNHDYDAARFGNMRMEDVMGLSKDAFDGITYSAGKLNDKDKKWLSCLPTVKYVEDPHIKFMIVHGSIMDQWGYILSKLDAVTALNELKALKAQLGFFGHTHLPTFVRGNINKEEDRVLFDDVKINLYQGKMSDCEIYPGEMEFESFYTIEDDYYLFNPGSIGQARNNGFTSFGVLDTEKRTFEIEGFKYDWKAAQKAVQKEDYSGSIAFRLDPEYDTKRKIKSKFRTW